MLKNLSFSGQKGNLYFVVFCFIFLSIYLFLGFEKGLIPWLITR